jgi:5-methylcytosine-specific restriction endonuclease McrA
MSVLERPVLVINNLYMAMRETSVRQALLDMNAQNESPRLRGLPVAMGMMIYPGDPPQFAPVPWETWLELPPLEDDRTVHCVRYVLRAPTVIMKVNSRYQPKGGPTLDRHSIVRRDKHRCQYCGRVFPESQLNMDHVVPKDQGGKFAWDNIVASCYPCNTKKRNRTPQQAGMKLPKRPIEPKLRAAVASLLVRHPDWTPFIKMHPATEHMHEG